MPRSSVRREGDEVQLVTDYSDNGPQFGATSTPLTPEEQQGILRGLLRAGVENQEPLVAPYCARLEFRYRMDAEQTTPHWSAGLLFDTRAAADACVIACGQASASFAAGDRISVSIPTIPEMTLLVADDQEVWTIDHVVDGMATAAFRCYLFAVDEFRDEIVGDSAWCYLSPGEIERMRAMAPSLDLADRWFVHDFNSVFGEGEPEEEEEETTDDEHIVPPEPRVHGDGDTDPYTGRET